MDNNDFLSQFPQIPNGGVSFVNICNYTNKQGEVECALINVGVSYENAKKKDVEYLADLDVSTLGSDLPTSLLEEARQALLGAIISPNKKRSEAQKNAYTHVTNGVKVHNENGQLYIFGMKVRKTTIVEGEYKEDTRRPLTKAKDAIRKTMKSTQYRQFIVPNFDTVSVKGDTLEIE
ncbi:MAG: hypothetical protein GTO02_19475 [Candidatus Dadabacteria bacterium]|nr:hypothetical protein [Candidatus Dadabacteria bacterium]